MADAPVTERRLIELLDVRFAAVDARFAAVDARFAAMDVRFAAVDARFTDLDRKLDEKLKPIVKDLKDVKAFQRRKAHAIEFELQSAMTNKVAHSDTKRDANQHRSSGP